MKIDDKIVVGIKVERDDFGRFSNTSTSCVLCDMPVSLQVRATFDDDWDEQVLTDVCADCLIGHGWFIDYGDLNMRG
jgi:hypothetical protein